MFQQDPSTIKAIIEIGTTIMLTFATSIIVLVYVLHERLIKQKYGSL
ncbi:MULTISPECIES: hypothetical protein [Arcicella]|uniref:Uncharacterized protein n=1 Tax=Arcicella aquatica TaxID=217141 RepID=A0ABU5QRS0_9BACT|nr:MULTISPECIES: hypothetical protein [Arcicella]MDR6561122.1 hypothetical protein [Arcicella sp. BE51]MDR6811006.1 hypothetical protein [Arcicella sp. BE140]MDR6822356.1 hypothetical protein [Arcicella sp. BE139]MEA5259766.1 hypothetical protein [Arcicella aquatica]